MMFNGREVASVCDVDLYLLWSTLHLFDDSFGPNHVFQTNADISKAWCSLLEQVDEVFFSTFPDEGVVGPTVAVSFFE